MKEPTPDIYVAISGRRWLRGQFLDAGGMSKVYRATCRDMPGNYVIKIGQLLSEMRVYTKLCTSSALGDVKNACIPEYIDGGVKKDTAEQFLIIKEYSSSYPPEETISDRAFVHIVRDTLTALRYFHENGYIHNDVKPDNILYDGNHFLLCDFGVTTKWRKEGNKNYTTDCFYGTKVFAGLDMHTNAKGPSPRSDVDSLIFSMVRWCAIKLPWSRLKALETIHEFKLEFLSNPSLLLSKCSSPIKRALVTAFLGLNHVRYHELPDYDAMERELATQEAKIQKPCCETCAHLELVKNTLMLSNNSSDKAIIKALKHVELW